VAANLLLTLHLFDRRTNAPLDEQGSMATSPQSHPAPTKRGHSLIAIGIVMAILLAALVALPFLARV
jgi:hypothetical protein